MRSSSTSSWTMPISSSDPSSLTMSMSASTPSLSSEAVSSMAGSIEPMGPVNDPPSSVGGSTSELLAFWEGPKARAGPAGSGEYLAVS